MSQDRSKLRWNGWGWIARKDEIAPREEVWSWLAGEFGMPALLATPARPLSDITLPPNKLSLEDRVEIGGIVGAGQLRDSVEERAFHARGRSYRDLLLLRSGDLSCAPDAVVYPRGNEEVLALLGLASERGIAVILFGGGTAITPVDRNEYKSVIALDLSDMDRIIAIDTISNTAEVEAGIYGPALETALKAKGLTLGYTPQEFEFSTAGDWIAGNGKKDWLLEAKLATPKGFIETEDPVCRGWHAGGPAGVITEATLKLKPAPAKTVYCTYLFRDFSSGAAAMRSALQEGSSAALHLYDAAQTRFGRDFDALGAPPNWIARLKARYAGRRGFGDGSCLLLATFEGDDRIVSFERGRFNAIAKRYNGLALGHSGSNAFRTTRLQTPYLRDSLLERAAGLICFEVQVNWAKLNAVHESLRTALERILREAAPREGAQGVVLGQISEATSHDASLYFAALFPRAVGSDLEQEEKITNAIRQAVQACEGTASHFHPKSETALAAANAFKQALDPNRVIAPERPLP